MNVEGHDRSAPPPQAQQAQQQQQQAQQQQQQQAQGQANPYIHVVSHLTQWLPVFRATVLSNPKAIGQFANDLAVLCLALLNDHAVAGVTTGKGAAAAPETAAVMDPAEALGHLAALFARLETVLASHARLPLPRQLLATTALAEQLQAFESAAVAIAQSIGLDVTINQGALAVAVHEDLEALPVALSTLRAVNIKAQ
nr:hypothetical protein HK105_004619 [Polyrhizophydium stewartii]